MQEVNKVNCTHWLHGSIGRAVRQCEHELRSRDQTEYGKNFFLQTATFRLNFELGGNPSHLDSEHFVRHLEWVMIKMGAEKKNKLDMKNWEW